MGEQQTVIYVTNNIGSVAEGAVIKGVEIGTLVAAAGGTGPAVIERRIPRVPAPRRPGESLLIGRETALQSAVERLRQGEKFYFHGTYGVGKTTLSSELFNRVVAAAEPADGYLWGSVAGMGVEDAIEWIAGALQETAVSATANTQSKINTLREAISLRKQLLIALDDVRDGSVAQALVEAVGDCGLILNGGRNLDLGGRVSTLELEPLTLEEARTLFLREAYTAEAAPSPTDLEQIDRIVERSGRLPLAVRLTARQRRQGVSLARLLDMLAYSPEVVFSAEEGLLSYLRSLQQELQGMNTARRLLARLAAFPAHEAPVEALQAGIPRREYYHAEGFLVERSILDRIEGDRLRLHGYLALWFQNASLPDYEAELPVVEGWLVDFARQNDQTRDYAALDREQANLIGLLERFKEEQRAGELVGLLRALFDFMRTRGMWAMNLQALDAALEDINALNDQTLTGWSYMQRGYMHTLRGERSGAEHDLAQADRIFAEIEDLPRRGETWYRQSALTQMSGDLNGAIMQLEQALTWMGETAPASARAGAHQRLGILYATQGKLAQAEVHLGRALTLGDAEDQAAASMKLGSLRRDAGDPAGAQSYFEQALPLIERLGLRLQRAQLHQEMGTLALQRGQRAQAGQHYEQARQLYEQLNYRAGLAYIQHLYGNLSIANGDDADDGGYAEAQQHYQSALEINLALGLEANAAYNRFMLGVVAQRQGQPAQAERQYRQALQAAQNMGDLGLQASCQYQLALLCFEGGSLADTGPLAEKAYTLAEQSADRQTQASALALLGRLDAAQGRTDSAKKRLSQAYTLFAAFNPADAQKVANLLATLDPSLGSVSSTSLDLDLLKGGGQVLQSNVGVFGSAPTEDKRQGLQDVGEDADPAPDETSQPGNIWQRSAPIDRITQAGVFRDFSVEPVEASMSDQSSARQPLVYRDFNLRFSGYNPADGKYRVWVEGVTPGGGSMTPDDAPTLTAPARLSELINHMDRRTSLWTEATVYELGSLLADLALPEGPVWRLFEDSLAATRRDHQGLRLRLHIDALPLANLPWEFICLRRARGEPQPSDFLALRREVSIARTDSVAESTWQPQQRLKFRLVTALSSPNDQTELDVSRDEEAIRKAVDALNQAAGKEIFEARLVERPTTPLALQNALKEGAELFHFGGHGEFQPIDQKGLILLERPDGTSEYYDAGRLAQLLRDAGMRLAVLGACDTGRRNAANVWSGVAPALTREGIPAVIANQFKIRDASAILIAAKIYHRVLAGFSVDEALFEARQAIFQSNNLIQRDWGTPVLYLRETDGFLFRRAETGTSETEGTASPLVEISNTFRSIAGEAVSAVIGHITGGTIRVNDRIDVVESGGKYTGVKIDHIGKP